MRATLFRATRGVGGKKSEGFVASSHTNELFVDQVQNGQARAHRWLSFISRNVESNLSCSG
jgi:hypothetical protein